MFRDFIKSLDFRLLIAYTRFKTLRKRLNNVLINDKGADKNEYI